MCGSGVPPQGRNKATDRAMCDHILSSVDHITKIHPYAGVMIMGDFNRMEDRLLKSYPLQQVVKSPTRIQTILDCIYTNIGHLYTSIQYYLPQDFQIMKRKPKPNIVSFRSGGANGKAMTAFDIKNMDWREVEYFYENITGILDRHMPIRTIKKHQCDKPWVTEAMKEAIKARKSALIVGKTLLFNYWRNKANRMNKKLHISYYKN